MKLHKVVVQPEAQKEVEAIRRHQNEMDPKRARRFITDFDACLTELSVGPHYQLRKGKYRHVTVGKLPYRVVFDIADDTVFVYQVRHEPQAQQEIRAVASIRHIPREWMS